MKKQIKGKFDPRKATARYIRSSKSEAYKVRGFLIANGYDAKVSKIKDDRFEILAKKETQRKIRITPKFCAEYEKRYGSIALHRLLKNQEETKTKKRRK